MLHITLLLHHNNTHMKNDISSRPRIYTSCTYYTENEYEKTHRIYTLCTLSNMRVHNGALTRTHPRSKRSSQPLLQATTKNRKSFDSSIDGRLAFNSRACAVFLLFDTHVPLPEHRYRPKTAHDRSGDDR